MYLNWKKVVTLLHLQMLYTDFACLCVSQGHKYVVQAEVLYKSWELDESQLAFVHMLRELEKNEMRGTYFRQSQTSVSHTKSSKGETGKSLFYSTCSL